MNYLIVTSSEEASNYAELLVKEIQRYDIRAVVFRNAGNTLRRYTEEDTNFAIKYESIKSKQLLTQKIDLSIFVGETFDKRLVKRGRRNKGKACFLQMTDDYLSGIREYERAVTSFDKVLVDLPIYRSDLKSEHIGHYLSDSIRRHDFVDKRSEQLSIGILIRDTKNLNSLSKLTKTFSKARICKWNVYSDLSKELVVSSFKELDIEVYSNKLDALKYSNAVIVDSETDSMAAALMNCPQVSISGKWRLFGFSEEKHPIVNQVAHQEVIKNFKPNKIGLIKNELNLILSDHEYCASMLTAYQEVKEEIGTQPVTRTVAQKLVEWLED